jgi:hypothetical protein
VRANGRRRSQPPPTKNNRRAKTTVARSGRLVLGGEIRPCTGRECPCMHYDGRRANEKVAQKWGPLGILPWDQPHPGFHFYDRIDIPFDVFVEALRRKGCEPGPVKP